MPRSETADFRKFGGEAADDFAPSAFEADLPNIWVNRPGRRRTVPCSARTHRHLPV